MAKSRKLHTPFEEVPDIQFDSGSKGAFKFKTSISDILPESDVDWSTWEDPDLPSYEDVVLCPQCYSEVLLNDFKLNAPYENCAICGFTGPRECFNVA